MLKKSLYFFLALLMIFTLSFNVVEARGLNNDSIIYALDGNNSQDAGCDAIFGDPNVIPSLINFFFELLGWYGTCGIG